jgi:hypothetical protein
MAAASEILDIYEGRIQPEPNSGCWIWTGSRNTKGHGEVRINWQKHYTHRLSWELRNGPIPDGLWVLHKCDNATCCNPDHLYLGTHNDNMRDMVVAGRHGGAVLAPDVVRQMRAARLAGRTFESLGRSFGVSAATAYQVISGKTWGHVQ